MVEKDVQGIFGKENRVFGVFELKLVKQGKNGKFPPMPFNRVAAHQIDALTNANSYTGLYYKISDSFIGDKSGERRFPSPKPFDCMRLCNVPAFVVICWYIPRKSKEFMYIPIEAFRDEMIGSTRMSLTYDRAKEIASTGMGR